MGGHCFSCTRKTLTVTWILMCDLPKHPDRECLTLFIRHIIFVSQMTQDPYPPMSKNRQASAPAASRIGSRPISGAYGVKNPTITRDEKSSGLSVTSSRMVRIHSRLSSSQTNCTSVARLSADPRWQETNSRKVQSTVVL